MIRSFKMILGFRYIFFKIRIARLQQQLQEKSQNVGVQKVTTDDMQQLQNATIEEKGEPPHNYHNNTTLQLKPAREKDATNTRTSPTVY
jgi:hypothetical protein